MGEDYYLESEYDYRNGDGVDLLSDCGQCGNNPDECWCGTEFDDEGDIDSLIADGEVANAWDAMGVQL